MDKHKKWWKLDGEYLEADVVELAQTDDLLQRFPAGVPIGTYLGKAEVIDMYMDEHNKRTVISNEINYKVIETYSNHPYQVRIQNNTRELCDKRQVYLRQNNNHA